MIIVYACITFLTSKKPRVWKIEEVEGLLRMLAIGSVRPLNFGEYMSAESGWVTALESKCFHVCLQYSLGVVNICMC